MLSDAVMHLRGEISLSVSDFCLVQFSKFTLTGESLLLPIHMVLNPIHICYFYVFHFHLKFLTASNFHGLYPTL